MPMDMQELMARFDYHAPTEEQRAIYEELRARFKALAMHLDAVLPESREKAVAFTQLETAAFWANSSIARRS